MMMPAGWAAQMWSAHGVLTAGTLGTGLLLLLAPLCTRVWALCAVLTTMGMCQAPLIPAQAVLKRSWVPTGEERPIALRILSLGSKASAVIATTLTPWLAIRVSPATVCPRHATRLSDAERCRKQCGWKNTLRIYGVGVLLFAALWHRAAGDQPPPDRKSPTPKTAPAPSSKVAATASNPSSAEPAVDLRIFRLPSVLAVIGGKFCWQAPTRCPVDLFKANGVGERPTLRACWGACSNYTSYSFTQWAPTIFADVLGCTPMQTAQCASPTALSPSCPALFYCCTMNEH